MTLCFWRGVYYDGFFQYHQCATPIWPQSTYTFVSTPKGPPKSWECHRCGRVYSPTVEECRRCNGGTL